jgi:hypothetical protein
MVGLLAMGFGAASIRGTSISVTLLTLGFICLLAGVVLPRIEGKFTAGPSGLSADIAAVHLLDRRYIVSGPELAVEQVDGVVAGELQVGVEAALAAKRVALGDVWDALDAAGFHPDGVGLGGAYFNLPGNRLLRITNRGFLDHGIASDELLALLASWGVRPTASGKYQVPPDGNPYYIERPTMSVRPPGNS